MKKNSYVIAVMFILLSAIGFSTLQMFVKLAQKYIPIVENYF